MRGPLRQPGSVVVRAALIMAFGCARETRHGPLGWIVIDAAGADSEVEAFGDAIAALNAARVEPASAVVRVDRAGARLMVGVDVRGRRGDVRIDVPGACPIAVSS